jgi:hypothetical protein
MQEYSGKQLCPANQTLLSSHAFGIGVIAVQSLPGQFFGSHPAFCQGQSRMLD